MVLNPRLISDETFSCYSDHYRIPTECLSFYFFQPISIPLGYFLAIYPGRDEMSIEKVSYLTDMISRRTFLESSMLVAGGAVLGGNIRPQQARVITVKGPIPATNMRVSLIHEHILVDFVGADAYDPKKWNRDAVIKKVLPFLQDLKKQGCNTLVECTPAYLGRDPILLQKLSTLSGLNIITNTGYYGGSVNKYLPGHAFTETSEQLADRWTSEFRNGIEDTGIKPGFIKISVNDQSLSEISTKLIQAAAICHLQTGLTIASHTGPAIPAFEQIEIVKRSGASPAAFIWVHAQNEKDPENYVLAAKQGAWVSLDALRDENVEEYIGKLSFMKSEKCLHRTLISHDAGWYEPHKPDGGTIRGYTTLFEKLIPGLLHAGFSKKDIAQLLEHNAAEAFGVAIRRIQ